MERDGLTLLAEAAAHGDDDALRRLVVETQDQVRSLCRRLGSPADAEDLAQETYLRMLRALPRFRGEAPVRVWLLSIARHVCADHVRRRVRRSAIDRRYRDAPTFGRLDDRVTVDDLVQRLDRDQAEAFVLTQELELSYAEAAEVCGCPIGTVRSRVSRARAALADMVRAADAS